ncbi:girdin-like [Littorina saxatilis]|uniref:girdin-like n=1 Tax=Littorina saxatilis TaxID=31220 RepID=UPI0038B44253
MEARLAVLETRQASQENVNSELKTKYNALKTRVHDVERKNSDLTTKYNALESNNRDLTTKYNALDSKNSDLTTKYNALDSKNSDLTTKYNALDSKNSDLTTKYNALDSKNSDLTTKYNALKTEKDVLENLLLNQTVSFHARLDTEKHDLPAGSTLILPTVVNNHGNAYDGSTGKFSAPYTATYCFLATTEDPKRDRYSVLSLVVDGTEVDYVLTDVALFSQSASVHAVVHLTAGQKVWLNVPETNNYNYFGPRATAFSGFLVDHSQ